MSYCKNCGKPAIEGAAFCPYCGTKMQDGDGYCPSCGRETVAGAPFCPYCGTRVAAASSGSGTCAVCGETLAPGQLFCSVCGTARASGAEQPPKPPVPPPAPAKQLVVSRRPQAFGSNLIFEVYIDQASAGTLYPGNSISITEFPDTVRVDICCMDNTTASWGALLSVQPDSRVSVEIHLEGRLTSDCRLIPEVSGEAAILKQAYYVASSGWPDW